MNAKSKTEWSEPMPDNPAPKAPPARKRKFLVIADGSEEATKALHFAALRAAHTGGAVTLLAVLSPADFQHWLGVENIMREEARAEAEHVLHKLAAQAYDHCGVQAELIVREGKLREQMAQLISEDPDIAVMVLGAGTSKEGPGPLVSSIASDAAGGFGIPVTIVPGDLSDDQIDLLA
ncbi:universal stress protein [Pyruvatibacter sp.]|uniref:universal stress protein n=1 Tax=unclassified Pyruvatibacter TaxID=2618840 RepID=UPI0029691108|nr:universal stress protein [Alphaproteobacteria bacterium]